MSASNIPETIYTIQSLNCLHGQFAIDHTEEAGLKKDANGKIPLNAKGQMIKESNWPTRYPKIVSNTQKVNPDIIKLQEIGQSALNDLMNGGLRASGYSAEHQENVRGDGVAVLYNNAKFNLLKVEKVLGPDNLHHIVANLEDKTTKKVIRVASFHLKGAPNVISQNNKPALNDMHTNGSAHAQQIVQGMNAKNVDLFVASGDTNAYRIENPKMQAFLSKAWHTDDDKTPTCFIKALEGYHKKDNKDDDTAKKLAKQRIDWNFVKGKDNVKPTIRRIIPANWEECSDHAPSIVQVALPAIAAAQPAPAPAPTPAPAPAPAPAAPAAPVKLEYNVLKTILTAQQLDSCIFEAPDSSGKLFATPVDKKSAIAKKDRKARWTNKTAQSLNTINNNLALVPIPSGSAKENIDQLKNLIANMRSFNALAEKHNKKLCVRIHVFIARIFSFIFGPSRYVCKTLTTEIKAKETDLGKLEQKEKERIEAEEKAKAELQKRLGEAKAKVNWQVCQDMMKEVVGLACVSGTLVATNGRAVDELYIEFANRGTVKSYQGPGDATAVMLRYLADVKNQLSWGDLEANCLKNGTKVAQSRKKIDSLHPDLKLFLKDFTQMLENTKVAYTLGTNKTFKNLLAEIPEDSKLGLKDEFLDYLVTNYKALFEPAAPGLLSRIFGSWN